MNQLLNKLKAIEVCRTDLKNILESKNVEIGTTETLPGLIGQVTKLHSGEEISPQEWTGVVEQPEPTDYYKGEEDALSVINIDDICSNLANTYTSYSGLVFHLIRVSDNPSNSYIKQNYFTGYNALIFSDTQTLDTSPYSGTHYWSTSQDIVAENGGRFRWVVGLVNSTTAKVGWNSKYLTPESVVYYKGTFRGIMLQPYYRYQNQRCYYDSNNNYDYYSNSYNFEYLNTTCPKYIEVKQGVTSAYSTGVDSYDIGYTDYNLKTLIVNGNINYSFNMLNCYNLEYFVYKGNTINWFWGLCNVRNPKSTYIKINANINQYIQYIYNNYNCYIQLKSCSSYLTYFQNNNECKFKIGDIGGNLESSCFMYCKNSEIEINSCLSIQSSCFDGLKDTYIKIGTIYGGIGSYAFRECYLLYPKLVCVSRSATTYSLDGACFYNSNIEELDMTESRIITIRTYNNSFSDNIAKSGNNANGYAFVNMPKFKTLKLSKYLTDLYSRALSNLPELRELDLGENLLNLGSYALADCPKLKSVVIPDTIKNIYSNAFNYDDALEYVYVGEQITLLPSYCFAYCKSLTNVVLPDRLAVIGDYCFSECENLETLTLPASVESINTHAFYNCTRLTHLSSPNGILTTIGGYCFQNCSNLVELPNMKNVTKIGSYAFRNCLKLPITIYNDMYDNLTSESAFAGTGTSIVFEGTVMEDLIQNIYLNGGEWSDENILALLYSLPDRSDYNTYTIYLGPTYNKLNKANSTNTSTTYNISYYGTIASRYVKEEDNRLKWSSYDETGAMTVARYVSNKNWSMA